MISPKAIRQKIAWRAVTPSIFLVFNSFVWYIFTSTIFNSVVSNPYLGFSDIERISLFLTYCIAVAITAIIGAKFLSRARTHSLFIWSLMGAIATFLLIAIPSSSILVVSSLTFFLGASIGLGLPSCLSYFADSVVIEKRGFASGVIWSGVGFVVLVLAFVQYMIGDWETLVVLTVWRLFGGFGFYLLSKENKLETFQKKVPSYLELIRKKETLLYLFPWLMFCLLNFSASPIVERVVGSDFAFVQLAEWGIVGIVAVIGGRIADIAGRKRIVIAGFVMLGIEYAAMSAFSGSSVTLYLFLVLDGVSWGFLASAFFTTVWGDLGEGHEKEKYYVLGGLPFVLASFLPVLIKPYVSDNLLPVAFSFMSFFLFLAVLPLMYAPETLPEKKIKEQELKGYLEKAKKEAEKYSQQAI